MQSPPIHSLCFSLALLLLLSWPFVSRAQQWVEHRPAGAGYRVEFPSPPKVISEDHGRLVMNRASVANKDNSRALMVSHTVYLSGPMVTLGQAPQRFAQQGHQVLSRTDVTVSGKPAQRLVVKDPKGYVVESVSVIQGRTLIQVTYASQTGEPTPQSRKFFASFAIVPK